MLCLPLFAVVLFAQTSQQQQTEKPVGPAVPAEQTTNGQTATPAPAGPPAPLELHNLTPEPHTATPAEVQAQKLAQLRAALSRLATMEANWGPKMSHRGMSLTLKETGRKQTPNGTDVSYELVGTGYTPDMQLTLIRWPLDGRIESVMSGIAVNAAGVAVCGVAAPGPSAPTDVKPSLTKGTVPASTVPSCTRTIKPGTPITLTATAAKGEAIRVALVSADHSHGAAASAVPFPIEGQDKGCKLEVIRGSKNAELVLIEGSGFQQDKTYTLGSESYGVKNGIAANIKPDGTFVTALLPAIQGHPTGNTVIYYQSATCTPTVSFDWGNGTYKVE